MMATLHIGSLCVSGLFLALAWILWRYAPEVTDRPADPASHSRFSVRLWAVCIAFLQAIVYLLWG